MHRQANPRRQPPAARPRRALRLGLGLVAAVAVVGVAVPSAASAASATSAPTAATRGADNSRTGWYPDQTGLTPALVSGGTFGQLFSTTVNGSVYGQPLVDDGQLLVNTENNYAYGLDPVSGSVLWSRRFGAPPQASALDCADLAPTMGITSTPVIDQATNTEYLVDAEYANGISGQVDDYLHALDLTNGGAEEAGFPVQIQGTASNNPAIAFDGTYELQRPGLLLMNGVVYVAFGAHCDIPNYQGWIAGVSEAGRLTTMWTTDAGVNNDGGGIWMSGGGLVSDGPGQILLATGNGVSNTVPTPGATPPATLSEAVVRLAVQGDGSLKVTDFFEPYDAATLDQNDLDFGSGSPVALPDTSFGTPTIPHLAVEVGKEGYVYLLNRDALGGYEQGPSGTDDVVGRYGPNGGVWSSPAVWPGDGGWVYIPTASGPAGGNTGTAGMLDAYRYGVDGTGKPTLDLTGSTADAFGFGSSAPVVTSNGTTSGTALVWTVWSPDGTGTGAELRAYDPVPVNGQMQLVYSAPVGTSSKFNPPGVAGNRLYVGTRTGAVLGFGAPVVSPVTAPPTTFPATVVGQSSTQELTLTASTASTVSALSASGPFTLGTPSQTVPASLGSGGTMTVPVTFTPTAAGPEGGSLTIATSGAGSTVVSLTGVGQAAGPTLVPSTLGVSFGGLPPGQQSTQTVSFTNQGAQPLTISGVTPPAAPFTLSGAPAPGAVLQPGGQTTVTLTFAPTANGNFADNLIVVSNGGTIDVAVTGDSSTPAQLVISPPSVSFGSVPIGQSVTRTFTLTNTGGSNLTIDKSKPPIIGPFAATTTLPEGTTMQPGASLVESVTFVPGAVGTANDRWIITPDDGYGLRTVQFSGAGTLGDPGATGWSRNGSATLVNGSVQLTPASRSVVGSTFAPVPVASSGLGVSFTSTISGSRSGGDGIALVLADPAATTTLGLGTTGHGFSGIPGLAVVLSTVKGSGAPARNFVGISDGPTTTKKPLLLHWLATTTAVPNLHAAVAVRVTLNAGLLTVSVNGTQVLATNVTVGPNVRLGFTGSTGATADTQVVSQVGVTAGGPVTMVGDPTTGGWTLNGSSALSGGSLQLTPASPGDQSGTVFWPTPVSSSNLSATFTTTIGGGGTTGADGLALVLADGSTAPTALGAPGGGLGFSGIPGVAVALDTYQNAVNPSNNFVGVTDGPVTPAVPDELHWLATDTNVANLRTTHSFHVSLVGGTLTVTMDGVQLLRTPVTVGPDVLIGFSGGTGDQTDAHSVSGVSITAAPRVSVAIGDPTAGGWSLNGSTLRSGGVTQLTQTAPGNQAGTAFWPTPVSSQGLTASFTTSISGDAQQGADGMGLVLADPSTAPTAVGASGGGLGFSGITGLCVALDTYQNAVNPSNNFIGVTDGPIAPGAPDQLHWLTTADVASPLRSTHTITVTLLDGTLTVSLDGVQVLTTTVSVGPQVLVGFSAGTGGITDTHSVGSVAISAA